jgi:hypothetical protein
MTMEKKACDPDDSEYIFGEIWGKRKQFRNSAPVLSEKTSKKFTKRRIGHTERGCPFSEKIHGIANEVFVERADSGDRVLL